MKCYHKKEEEDQPFQMLLNQKLTAIIMQQHFALIRIKKQIDQIYKNFDKKLTSFS